MSLLLPAGGATVTGPDATYVFTTNGDPYYGTPENDHTFSNVPIGPTTHSGTGQARTNVVVCAMADGNAGNTITGGEIGGNTATLDVQQGSASEVAQAAIFSYPQLSGTTADIKVVTSNTKNRYGIGVISLYGSGTAAFDTASDYGTTLSTSACGVAAGGILVACGGGTQKGPVSWSAAVDEFCDNLVDGWEEWMSGAAKAYAAADGSPTVTCTPTTAIVNNAMVVASYSKA